MMTRNWRLGLVAVTACACALLIGTATSRAVQGDKVHEVGKDGLKIDGKLTTNDPRDAVRSNSYAKVYLVKLQKDKVYTIRLNSPDQMALDPWLRIEDDKKKELAFNDDDFEEKTLNSRIDFKAPADGTFRIIATSFGDNQTGDYTLLIKEKGK